MSVPAEVDKRVDQYWRTAADIHDRVSGWAYRSIVAALETGVVNGVYEKKGRDSAFRRPAFRRARAQA